MKDQLHDFNNEIRSSNDIDTDVVQRTNDYKEQARPDQLCNQNPEWYVQMKEAAF